MREYFVNIITFLEKSPLIKELFLLIFVFISINVFMIPIKRAAISVIRWIIFRKEMNDEHERIKTELAILQEERKKINVILKKLEDINKNFDEKQSSIIDKLYKKNNRMINHAIAANFLGIVIYYFTNIVLGTDIEVEIIMLLYGSTILVLILKALIYYRVKKGYYGMNYDECKELIQYLMNDIDKNDIDKGKKIFNETNDYKKARGKNPSIIGETQY